MSIETNKKIRIMTNTRANTRANMRSMILSAAKEVLFQSTCEGSTPSKQDIYSEINLHIDFEGIVFENKKARLSFVSSVCGQIAKLNYSLFCDIFQVRKYDRFGNLTLDRSQWV